MKKLYNFTASQLLRGNVHMGCLTKNWNPLNNLLVVGKRQGFFILNLSMTILLLRRAFLIIESRIGKRLNVLIHTDNKFMNYKLLFAYKYYRFLPVSFVVGSWVSGFLSNFRTFYFLVLPRVKRILKLFYRRPLRNYILRYVLNKFWIFFIFLNKLRYFPNFLFSFTDNQWAISETRSLLLPSSFLTDLSISESALLHSSLLIPYNTFSVKSLNTLFLTLSRLLVVAQFRRKKLFLLLLLNLLESTKVRKKINLNFSLFVTLYKIVKMLHRGNQKYSKKYLHALMYSKFLNLIKLKV